MHDNQSAVSPRSSAKQLKATATAVLIVIFILVSGLWIFVWYLKRVTVTVTPASLHVGESAHVTIKGGPTGQPFSVSVTSSNPAVLRVPRQVAISDFAIYGDFTATVPKQARVTQPTTVTVTIGSRNQPLWQKVTIMVLP